MLLEVAIQVGLLSEATIAQVALEGFLLVVDVANVTLQVGGDAEGAVTVFTPVGEVEVVMIVKLHQNAQATIHKYNFAS